MSVYIFGLELWADNCAALRRAVRELLWRSFRGGEVYFSMCMGAGCSLAVYVSGGVGSALYYAATLVWYEYRRQGGRALQLAAWRIYKTNPHREPALRKVYKFGEKRRPVARCV